MVEAWGQTSAGRDIKRITLKNGGLTCAIITFGASIQDLRLEGHGTPLVLGLASVAAYEAHGLYFGAVVGRCANRIAGGRFCLNKSQVQLALDDASLQHLHGGPHGFFNQVWDIESAGENSVTLRLESPDGDMGYPGNLVALCHYHLTADNRLEVTLQATSDAPTVCNLASHAYFNLEDGGASDVNLHRIAIASDRCLEVDDNTIPTGIVADVSGTELDLRELRQISDFSDFDHNFCLSTKREKLRRVAEVFAPTSGITMDVLTTEPGLQFYGGTHIGPMMGLDGIAYAAGSGFCLEAQIWPDAINHAHFPSAILKPREMLEQKTVYRFTRAAG
ncbi:MAG: aldose epimerase family protein [Ahrensia sp.]|nr:aldose epimerase family protein [Ahrensia sp.]